MSESFRSLGEFINNDSSFKRIRNTIKKFDVVSKFSEIFPDLQNIAVPDRIEKGTLYLKVENAAWRAEINFSKSKLIEKVNEYFKEKVITEVRLLS